MDEGLQGLIEGEIILKTLLKQAKEAGNTHVLLHAVDGDRNDLSYCFFRKHGAEVLNVHHKRWYQESLNRGWLCPRCGNPCECSSIEMLIDLEKLDNLNIR